MALAGARESQLRNSCGTIDLRELGGSPLAGDLGGVPGKLVGSVVLPIPLQTQSHAFQVVPSLSGRFTRSWLCAPCMAVVHPSDSCLHI